MSKVFRAAAKRFAASNSLRGAFVVMRNLPAHAGKQGRRVVAAFAGTAFARGDAGTAKARWRKMAGQLRPKVPKLAALMDEAENDALATMTFPAAPRAELHRES